MNGSLLVDAITVMFIIVVVDILKRFSILTEITSVESYLFALLCVILFRINADTE